MHLSVEAQSGKICPKAHPAHGKKKVQKVITCQNDESIIPLMSSTNVFGLDHSNVGMLHQLQSSLYGSREMQPPAAWGIRWEMGMERESMKRVGHSLINLTKLWGIYWEGWTRPSDQKVPSWNLIISTVSRLKFKLCAAIWRPSGQGLTESPVIRNGSYYHNPKSYLNSSLMWLWFPRTICCYCNSAQMCMGATNRTCLLGAAERRIRHQTNICWL